MSDQLDPTPILETATAFWASKVLLTAVEFDLFTALGEREMTAIELGDALGLHPRGTYDFFDALVAMGFLERNGDGAAGRYRNTPLTGVFLDKRSASYIGGFPQMLNSRLFGFWNGLGEGLKTGQPQNEVKLTGRSRGPFATDHRRAPSFSQRDPRSRPLATMPFVRPARLPETESSRTL